MNERLDDLDRNEMWDVARQLRPDLTREDFDELWAAFQVAKAERAMQ